MLENIDGRQYDYLPHKEQYDRRVARLRAGLAAETTQLITEYCDRNGEVTAGRLFGVAGFTGKHREMVAALGGVEDEANQLIGQMLWEALRVRPEVWRLYRRESEGEINPVGMHYWRA